MAGLDRYEVAMNKISTLKNKEIPKIYMQLATLALTAVILVSTCLCTFLYYRHVKALENQAIAMSTIIDSNITTLIAGLVLFQFGTGPVKGFAVTLTIGILSSIFTAVTLSKTIFLTLYGNKEIKKLSV